MLWRQACSILLLFFTLVALTSPCYPANRILDGTAIKVADGDTITVRTANYQQYRVRIAGIDAPEKGQAFGNTSKKRLTAMVAGKEVRVE